MKIENVFSRGGNTSGVRFKEKERMDPMYCNLVIERFFHNLVFGIT